ncbi:hypothetical protein [Egicoccus sp. AB-alg2]|uniref:hypothetical protein n=1 Tax=Egicoccus sp. AB-alg2 TaxID=3242693 RepID=UPI00359D859C
MSKGTHVYEQVQRQEHRPVVALGSQPAAELLVTTLRVHGIEAMTAPASVYPSIDWVEGHVVAVAEADLERARELLRDLGHEPLPTG